MMWHASPSKFLTGITFANLNKMKPAVNIPAAAQRSIGKSLPAKTALAMRRTAPTMAHTSPRMLFGGLIFPNSSKMIAAIKVSTAVPRSITPLRLDTVLPGLMQRSKHCKASRVIALSV